MNTFLSKISQLPSIQKVLFLSIRGEVLFANDEVTDAVQRASLWQAVIGELHSPMEAELYFAHGGYYLHSTEIGYIIIGMKNFDRLAGIKAACAQLQTKLSDSTICKKVLFRMLQDADQTLKSQFVLTFLPYADQEVAEKLLVVFRQSRQFAPEVRGELQENICRVLGQSRSPAAHHALQKMLSDHAAQADILDDKVHSAAQVAVAQLELALPRASDPVSSPAEDQPAKVQSAVGQVDSSACSATAEKDVRPPIPEGSKIETLLQRGEKEAAIAVMVEQIEMCAAKNQFDMADRLREWLIQADSSALREIIRTAEIIEEQKNAAISDAHREVWSKLGAELSTEEFSSLYHAMDHRHYRNGEIVVEQGQFVSTLFFVDSGRVQLFSKGQGREYALKVIEAGEMFGAETFFDISIWTMSARSLGADISLLSWERLLRLKESSPALRGKLMDFSSRFKLTNSAFAKAGITRRLFERVKVSGKVTVVLLNKKGGESAFGTKGTLLDISCGGLAFSLRFSKKKNAVALLGQLVRVSVRPNLSADLLQRNGVVKAVHCHDFVGNDYTIHMEFQQPLSPAEVSKAAGKKN